MRLGIFGGSFDPPHVGHLLAAVDAFDALQLDRLIFVPAATQPFKAGQPNTPGHLRLAMLQLMVGTDPRFEVSPVEIERDGLSYTVETLTAFAGQYPAAERFFLIGADAFAAFGQWREPRRITQLARVAVLQRAGV